MASDGVSMLERVRQPEYVGENRCTPCTILNVGIAVAASAIAWAVGGRATSGSVAGRLAAAAVLVASLSAIYLRGYLVPGTPTFTKRYLPDPVLALFDKRPIDDGIADAASGAADRSERESGDADEPTQQDAVDPEHFLLDADVVAPCEREDDLCLSDEFAARLEARTEQFRSEAPDAVAVAGVFDAEPAVVTPEDGGEFPAFEIRDRVRKWPSEGALVADVAADRALREQAADWGAVPREQRLAILESLRSFRETCPRCSGRVELGTETVESCCRSYEVATASCLGCGETLLEFDPSAIDADGENKTA